MSSDEYEVLSKGIKEVKELLENLLGAVLPPAQTQTLTIKDLMTRWKCSYRRAYDAMHSPVMKATKTGKQLVAMLKNVERYEEAYKVRN